MHVAEWFVGGLAVYALAGAVFAAGFVAAGIQRVDRVAENASLGFRLIVLPGVAALWPVLLVRWIRTARRDAAR